MDTARISYTTINHTARLELGLSMNEYAVADLIYNLQNNPSSYISGWCFSSKAKIGESLGLTEKSVHVILSKLISLGLVEKDPITKYLRITSNWYNTTVLTNTEESTATLKKVQPMAVESSVETSKEEERKESNKEKKEEEKLRNYNNSYIVSTNVDKEFGNSSINQGMEVLKSLLGENPPRLRENRYALNRLYKSKGQDRVLRAIKVAFSIKEEPYAPQVNNYIDLEAKWQKLESFFARKNKGGKSVDVEIEIQKGAVYVPAD